MHYKLRDEYIDRARGMLVGLAVGDALGAPIEFGVYSSYIQQMGDKIFHFYDSPRGCAGQWTDDTAMALCIADSLIEKNGYDSYDIMNRFYRWLTEGYRSHDGRPADDVGHQTRLELFKYCESPVRHRDEPKTESAGNAPIMRLAPVVIANTFPSEEGEDEISAENLWSLSDMAILSCRETHNSIAAECTTSLFATALYSAILGYDKSDIIDYASRRSYRDNDAYDSFWTENADQLVQRWQNNSNGDDLRDLPGYIVDTFAIAMWGFVNTDTFEDGMKKVLCLGGDTDTNAAVYGQIAGAYYGYSAIPNEWKDNVLLSEELVAIADKLLNMKQCPVIRTRFEDNKYFQAPNKEDGVCVSKAGSGSPSTARPVERFGNIKSLNELLKERLNKEK